MKKVTFIYPTNPDHPMGGLKVIYDYSNYLVQKGIDVNIVFCAFLSPSDCSLIRIIKSVIKYFYSLLFLKPKGCSWFDVDKRIKLHYIFEPKQSLLPNSDVYIATSANTALYIDKLLVPEKRKFYFLQGYESFILPEDKLIETFHYKLKKIAISQWLTNLIKSKGLECNFVPNGFHFDQYYITVPIEKKDPYKVSMLYHTSLNKGINVGIEALKIVKDAYPELKVDMFGVYDSPNNLPIWCTYFQNPTHEVHLKINNTSALFIGTSFEEGWGLTVGEAMMCGQAVVCTDNNGYREMAINGRNALLSPAGDTISLANNIIRMFEDQNMRIRLAKQGFEDIKQFDIFKSYVKFKEALSL